jgi:histidine triad (HIT) family protein
MDCVFCKIAGGDIPVAPLHSDDEALAFADLNPQAPFHALVIPRRHIASIAEGSDDDSRLLGRLLLVAAKVAREQGLGAGYRVVTNVGPDGGQSVNHLHLHVLGGRRMGWPPG